MNFGAELRANLIFINPLNVNQEIIDDADVNFVIDFLPNGMNYKYIEAQFTNLVSMSFFNHPKLLWIQMDIN